MLAYALRSPYADDGLDDRGDGGGTAGSSLDGAICSERLLRGLVADAWKALLRSSAENESLRGIWAPEEGMGIVSVIVELLDDL